MDRFRLFRLRGRRGPENNPLFQAVLANDLPALKTHIQAGQSPNLHNDKGHSLLHFVIRRNRVEIFDYLLTLPELDVNQLDCSGQTPLLYLIGLCFDEYFALELLKRGAQIDAVDASGYSILHVAAKSPLDDNVNVARAIIEMGGDVNAATLTYQATPLYVAADAGNFAFISLLLYYNCDVMLSNANGVLPLAALSDDFEEREIAEQILFDYTFNPGEKIDTRLACLVASMRRDSLLFRRIAEHTSQLLYDRRDLQYLLGSLVFLKRCHLEFLLSEHRRIFAEMIHTYAVLDVIVKSGLMYGRKQLQEVVRFFAESEFGGEFVRSSDPRLNTISRITEICFDDNLVAYEREFTELVCLLLCNGLTVTSFDLDTVFYHYGDCELFRILLHQDIIIDGVSDAMTVARLFYEPFVMRISDFHTVPECWSILVDFYHRSRLKRNNIAVQWEENEQLWCKVVRQPAVPLLLELSRDVARQFICDHYNVKSSVQFYTIVQNLPIGARNQRIIALQEELY